MVTPYVGRVGALTSGRVALLPRVRSRFEAPVSLTGPWGDGTGEEAGSRRPGPDVSSPDVSSPDVSSPDVSSPDVMSLARDSASGGPSGSSSRQDRPGPADPVASARQEGPAEAEGTPRTGRGAAGTRPAGQPGQPGAQAPRSRAGRGTRRTPRTASGAGEGTAHRPVNSAQAVRTGRTPGTGTLPAAALAGGTAGTSTSPARPPRAGDARAGAFPANGAREGASPADDAREDTARPGATPAGVSRAGSQRPASGAAPGPGVVIGRMDRQTATAGTLAGRLGREGGGSGQQAAGADADRPVSDAPAPAAAGSRAERLTGAAAGRDAGEPGRETDDGRPSARSLPARLPVLRSGPPGVAGSPPAPGQPRSHQVASSGRGRTLPAAVPARPADTEVSLMIGRVEVRVQQPPAREPVARPVPARRPSSLASYLEARTDGRVG